MTALPALRAPGHAAGPVVLAAAVLLGGCVPAVPPASSPAAEVRPDVPMPTSPPAPAPAEVSPPPVTYDLPIVSNLRVADELNFLVTERPQVLRTWMARGVFYQDFIETVLEEHGLPRDLYFLAMIESGFVPTARSHAGAVGMWQFMARTGRSEGLRIDDHVDERRDPVRSTRAAARHLARLYRQFGDWPLATAAYNAGAGRVSRGMERFGARDFWDLAARGDLARETRQYVPRLYAVTQAGRDPARFGLPEPRPEGVFAFDSLHVSDAVPLAAIAGIGGLDAAALETLNPHILAGRTPPGPYVVWVPEGSGRRLQTAYDEALRNGGLRPTLVAGDPATQRPLAAGSPPPASVTVPAGPDAAVAGQVERAGVRAHEVAEGEHLWSIARRYGVSIAALESANDVSGVVRPGDRLVIPDAGAEAAGGEEVRGDGIHVVEPGDTLWRIGQRYAVPVEELRAENGLAEEDAIRPGQELRIPR